jgi:hypothetical protein
VALAISTSGVQPPQVIRNGNNMLVCISWYGKGVSFENCDRNADHGVLTEVEATVSTCGASSSTREVEAGSIYHHLPLNI